MPKSSDMLTNYVNKSYSNYINVVTSRYSTSSEGMTRSKSTYNTYSSQIIDKYKRSNSSSRSTHNLKPSKSSQSVHAGNNKQGGTWYKPKPLQLPAFLSEKILNDSNQPDIKIEKSIDDSDQPNIKVEESLNDHQGK